MCMLSFAYSLPKNKLFVPISSKIKIIYRCVVFRVLLGMVPDYGSCKETRLRELMSAFAAPCDTLTKRPKCAFCQCFSQKMDALLFLC